MMNHEDEEVLELINEIKTVVSQCWNCNFCYAACPLRESNVGFQTQGPSGIAQSLFYAIKWDCLEGPEKEGLRDIVYACTTCNSCVNTCKQISAGDYFCKRVIYYGVWFKISFGSVPLLAS